MHSAVESMLKSYDLKTPEDHIAALKEIIQEIALLGLYREGFFKIAAFYGGTALRIFHGLDRFSEDLDFSLLKKDGKFDLSPFTAAVRNELGAYGFEMEVEEKVKKADSPIKSTFIKGGTLIHLLKISSISPPVSGVHRGELIKVKLEVDTDPPGSAGYDIRYHLVPVPFSARLFDPHSLFAGKVHALLCRGWQGRVKGRDFYDFVWFVSRGVPLSAAHLRARLVQTGDLGRKDKLSEDEIRRRLLQKFTEKEIKAAKKDILPFIRDGRAVEVWSEAFFKDVVKEKMKVG